MDVVQDILEMEDVKKHVVLLVSAMKNIQIVIMIQMEMAILSYIVLLIVR